MSQTNSVFPLRFENAKPVAPEELLFALQLGQAAATHNMPTPSPSAKPIMLEDIDGSVSAIRFADSPQNRALLAVNKHYHDDKAKAFSIQVRIWAVAEALHDKRMQEWCKLRAARHEFRWFRKEFLPSHGRGWQAVYGSDGRYLLIRNGHEILILAARAP